MKIRIILRRSWIKFRMTI